MGREIKRVPLDFDWPIDQTWEGFWNPFREKFCKKCPSCDGRFYNPETVKLKDQWYGFDVPTPVTMLAQYGYNAVEAVLKGEDYARKASREAFNQMTPTEQAEFLRLLKEPKE